MGLPVDNDAASGVPACAASEPAVPPPTFFGEGFSLPEGRDAIVLPSPSTSLLLNEFCVLWGCPGPSESAAGRQASVAHPNYPRRALHYHPACIDSTTNSHGNMEGSRRWYCGELSRVCAEIKTVVRTVEKVACMPEPRALYRGPKTRSILSSRVHWFYDQLS